MKKSIAIFFCIAITSLSASAQEKRPPAPQPPPPVEVIKYYVEPPAVELDTLYQKNPSVARAWFDQKQHLFVQLKDGKKEEYNLENDHQFRAFVEKYRCLPPALSVPPPPPPPPPAPKNIQ
jgi:hypothetical protein